MKNKELPDLFMLTDAEVNKKYYLWLCDLIDPDRIYKLLIRTLYMKNFYWSVPNDDNRVFEGKELRSKFCGLYNILYDENQFSTSVSVLELVIALAYRCEYIMSDQGIGFEMRDWFWKILSNIGLDKAVDDSYSESTVIVILDKIIDRSYKRDGTGGLFPLKKTKKDQRKVELWYQLNEYLVENYYT